MKNIIITGAANGVGKAVANILKENNLILIDEDYKNSIDGLRELYNSPELTDDNFEERASSIKLYNS